MRKKSLISVSLLLIIFFCKCLYPQEILKVDDNVELKLVGHYKDKTFSNYSCIIFELNKKIILDSTFHSLLQKNIYTLIGEKKKYPEKVYSATEGMQELVFMIFKKQLNILYNIDGDNIELNNAKPISLDLKNPINSLTNVFLYIAKKSLEDMDTNGVNANYGHVEDELKNNNFKYNNPYYFELIAYKLMLTGNQNDDSIYSCLNKSIELQNDDIVFRKNMISWLYNKAISTYMSAGDDDVEDYKKVKNYLKIVIDIYKPVKKDTVLSYSNYLTARCSYFILKSDITKSQEKMQLLEEIKKYENKLIQAEDYYYYDAKLMMGNAYFVLKKYNEAKEIYTKLKEDGKCPGDIVNLANENLQLLKDKN